MLAELCVCLNLANGGLALTDRLQRLPPLATTQYFVVASGGRQFDPILSNGGCQGHCPTSDGGFILPNCRRSQENTIATFELVDGDREHHQAQELSMWVILRDIWQRPFQLTCCDLRRAGIQAILSNRIPELMLISFVECITATLPASC